MPKARTLSPVQSRFFIWGLELRPNGYYYADGRSHNPVNAGRHSLRTRNYQQALEDLRKLDVEVALRLGLARSSDLDRATERPLPIDEGAKLYIDGVSRSNLVGGATKKTRQRYKAVFDKFAVFCRRTGVHSWQALTKQVLLDYESWLHEKDYAYRTRYLELNTIKQAINWLAASDEKYLSPSCRFALRLQKPRGTPTYAYEPSEVFAILQQCKSHCRLHWLWRVIVMLAYSGLRIGEVAQLEWTDINFDLGMIEVRDESRGERRADVVAERSTKTHQSRSVPMHEEVRAMLLAIPGKHVGRVFSGPRGGVLKPDTVRVIFVRDVIEPLKPKFPKQGSAKGFEDGRIHSFRHFFCSYALRNGANKDHVQMVLGHTSSKMTDLYAHRSGQDVKSIMGQIKPLGEGQKKRKRANKDKGVD